MEMNCVWLKRLRDLGVDQSGAIAAYAAVALVVFLGFAALTLDIGRIAVVKSELQKAADAGALAGAKALGAGTIPSWSSGETAASSTVQLNSVAGELLTDCTVTYGYWSTLSHTLQDSTITPLATDLPAIRVVVSKIGGENGGPLQLFFAPILGMDTSDLNGTAIAIKISTGGSSGGGGGWGILEIGTGKVTVSGNVAVNGNVGVNGDGKVTISGSSGINGNLWVNGNGGVDLSGTAYVHGSLWDNGSGNYTMSGSASVQSVAYLDNSLLTSFGWSTSINGQIAQNNGVNGFITTGAVSTDASGAVAAVQPYAEQALTAYNNFITLAATDAAFPTVINNTANWNEPVRTITGTGGQNVVNLTSFNISGDGNLTLNAPETGSFIINVTNGFNVSGAGWIKLSGGLTPENVTFVYKGTSDVNVGAGCAIQGSILSPNAKINFSGNAAYNGTLVGGKDITLSGSVHSPPNLSWLVPGGGAGGATTTAHLVQ